MSSDAVDLYVFVTRVDAFAQHFCLDCIQSIHIPKLPEVSGALPSNRDRPHRNDLQCFTQSRTLRVGWKGFDDSVLSTFTDIRSQHVEITL